MVAGHSMTASELTVYRQDGFLAREAVFRQTELSVLRATAEFDRYPQYPQQSQCNRSLSDTLLMLQISLLKYP